MESINVFNQSGNCATQDSLVRYYLDDVLRQLAQQYASLEEKDIELVVETFRQLLKQAFAEAKEPNPDKRAIRLMLR